MLLNLHKVKMYYNIYQYYFQLMLARSKVETSPYIFWWLGLTHNSDYIELCNNPSANRFKTNNDILKVYKDFGDVPYEGDKHIIRMLLLK